jgi:Protein of unknown function (DUF3102)
MSIAEYKNLDDEEPDSREYWAGRINGTWQNAAESIIETGRILIEAKAALLPRGEFTKMVENDLLFTPRTAQRLMEIARNTVLSDPTHVSLLPPSWGTLYELTKLPPEILEAKIIDGTINPKMERRDVAKLRPGDDAAKHKAKMAPISRLKEENEELEREIADLKEELASAETGDQPFEGREEVCWCSVLIAGAQAQPEDIVDIICVRVGEDKAKEIANAILERFKKRRGRPAKVKQQAAESED